MSSQALTLSDRDFDAYVPQKATSNAYSRPRLEIKQRAVGWARGVVARIRELGTALEVYASDEHLSHRNKKRVDCQWVFFERDQAAHDELDRLLDRGRRIADVIDDPSPYTRHAFLALRIDDHGVEVAFAVHPSAEVDVDNLRARLDDEARAAELVAAIHALPRELTVGVDRAQTEPDLARMPATDVTPESIRATLAQAKERGAPLWIGWWVDRSVAITHAEIMSDQLADALVALAPIYKLVAWSRDNDFIAIDRRIERAEEERRRAHAEAEAEVTRWRAEQAEQEASRRPHEEPKGRAISLASLFKPSGVRAPARAAPSSPSRVAEPHDGRVPTSAPAPQAPVAPEAPKPPKRHPLDPRGPERSQAASPAVIEPGVKVRVLKGPFADKSGVVSELDGKGGARVLLGLLSTRFDLADLEIVNEGRERPAIQSSHRRPPPAAARKARG